MLRYNNKQSYYSRYSGKKKKKQKKLTENIISSVSYKNGTPFFNCHVEVQKIIWTSEEIRIFFSFNA